MNDIFSALGSLKPEQISAAAKKARAFAATPEGKRAMQSLAAGEATDALPLAKDKQSEIVSALKNNPEALKKLTELFK